MIKKMLSIIMCVAIVMSGSTNVFAQQNDLYEILSETIIIEENGDIVETLVLQEVDGVATIGKVTSASGEIFVTLTINDEVYAYEGNMNLIESDMVEINEELVSTYSSKEIIDLGTRIDKYSTKDVVISVALLAAAIAAASGLALKIAKTIAADVVAASYFLTDDGIYYTSHVNNKMVYLDGEFAYYISTINTYVYADSRRTDLITWSQTSGESLSPMRIEL